MPRLLAILTSAVLIGSVGGAASGAPVSDGPIVALNANRSTNWSGYEQGTLERGNTLFHQVMGDWTVPTASQHAAGQAEYSSTWIGIGGGCVNASCSVTDTTLIQEGTEQDVSAGGTATYSAWFELIPAPSVRISLAVHPGDRIHALIAEAGDNSNVWAMSMTDLTTGRGWSQMVPYSSTHATAEWILETPLVIGRSGAGLSPMPNLTTVAFDHATVNGAGAGLASTEEIQLADPAGHAVATPSTPDPDADGFHDCTYAGSCSAPTSS